MNEKKSNKEIFIVILTIFIFIFFFCGCTENNNKKDDVNYQKFIGSWSGNMVTSMFSFDKNNFSSNHTNNFENSTNRNFTRYRENLTNATITKLEFNTDTVEITFVTDNETQIVTQTYSIDGNQIIFSFQSKGEFPGGGFPMNNSGERPSFEGENPFENVPPTDIERPPFDGEGPINGEPPSDLERRSFNGQNPLDVISYRYSFSNNSNILYLDDYEFIKN